MTLSKLASITTIAATVIGGLYAVGSYAMGELDKKASIVYIDQLVKDKEDEKAQEKKEQKAKDIKRVKSEIRTLKRDRDWHEMKESPDRGDKFMVKSLQAHIEELELELQLTQ